MFFKNFELSKILKIYHIITVHIYKFTSGIILRVPWHSSMHECMTITRKETCKRRGILRSNSHLAQQACSSYDQFLFRGENKAIGPFRLILPYRNQNLSSSGMKGNYLSASNLPRRDYEGQNYLAFTTGWQSNWGELVRCVGTARPLPCYLPGAGDKECDQQFL